MPVGICYCLAITQPQTKGVGTPQMKGGAGSSGGSVSDPCESDEGSGHTPDEGSVRTPQTKGVGTKGRGTTIAEVAKCTVETELCQELCA